MSDTPDQWGILTTIAPPNLKFRPIISSSFSPTSHLSAFLDEILKPLVPKLNSYCRDTFHFLELLPASVEENSLFISFDVTSLYTSIPHDLGYEAIKYWVDKYRDDIPEKFSKQFILDSLRVILQNNFFSFEDNIYVQKSGTAMGTKVAPSYASLVMGFLEEKLYNTIFEEYSFEAHDIQNSWIRYLDDCWIIWKVRYGDHTKFHDILNNLHPAINFTKEISDTSLNFLDVRVYRDDDLLVKTDIYRKPTDTMSYVPFDSAHPRHVLRNIPYNLAFRIKRIVSDPRIRQMRYNTLKTRLSQLKYPSSLITDAITKAENRINETVVDNSSQKIIPFIQTYNKNNPNLYDLVVKPITNTLLLCDPFHNCQVRRSYYQPKSLSALLCRNNRKTISGITKCNEPRCKCCDIIITGSRINFPTPTGVKHFNVRHNLNCQSSNLIYKLECCACHKYYIGQTGDTLRHRMTVHRQQIRNIHYSFLKVSRHIRDCGQNEFVVAPFYQMHPSSSRLDRESKESMFISLFLPALNNL